MSEPCEHCVRPHMHEPPCAPEVTDDTTIMASCVARLVERSDGRLPLEEVTLFEVQDAHAVISYVSWLERRVRVLTAERNALEAALAAREAGR